MSDGRIQSTLPIIPRGEIELWKANTITIVN